MQLYALNQQQQLTLANQAHKHTDYQCMECQKRVRVRGGLHRQNHFYHLEPNRHCHLSGKGMVHLQVQLFIWKLLSNQECFIEHRFPTIRRIADVAWVTQRLVFEIQCSPISVEEILTRNQDYGRLGWQVIWILHDQRYNQSRLTAAEWILRPYPHYFTNIDNQGNGIIYDQFDLLHKGFRCHKLKPLSINLTTFQFISPSSPSQIPSLQLIKNRLARWRLAFQGDLIDLTLRSQYCDYIQQARALEEMHEKSAKAAKWTFFKEIIYQGVIRPYFLLFQLLLEKVCR